MRVIGAKSLLPEVKRERRINIQVDGRNIEAFEGETIATALLAAGIFIFRESLKKHEPRSVYCGMGTCCECLVCVDGHRSVRACMTEVVDGMKIETNRTA
jgi:predicted molibdopterin-dependent oxidoreductase YjgC